MVYTIVTSDILGDIAAPLQRDELPDAHRLQVHRRPHPRAGQARRTYICGGEESYGFLIGDFVRDKDAVSACALVAEMAAVAKGQGRTLYEELARHVRPVRPLPRKT
ncbi:MAG: hypothetical protein WKG07_15900 [Hymenobacter sp.]